MGYARTNVSRETENLCDQTPGARTEGNQFDIGRTTV